jgi:hypothetical protein
MVRDGKLAFLGSQSLRAMELDGRREVGLIFQDANAVRGLMRIFENDWTLAVQAPESVVKETAQAAKVAKRVAKAVARELPQVVGDISGAGLDSAEVEELVKDAVKDAVRDAVQGVIEEAVEKQESVAP